jgi:hypothetical protein
MRAFSYGMNAAGATRALPRRIDIKQYLEPWYAVRQTNRITPQNHAKQRNTAIPVEGGTGVAVWKNLAVDDSVKQLSTTARLIIGMVRAGNHI